MAKWLVSAAIVIVALVVAAIAGWAIFVRSSRPDAPGSFYSAPSPLPDGPPGTIIRSEVIDGFTSGATAYRVLYKSTGEDGADCRERGHPRPRRSVAGRRAQGRAYTHGTVGVASSCAPSLVTNPEQQPVLVEGGPEQWDAGYVLAATDYQGLGTPGPHPYLVGAAEAHERTRQRARCEISRRQERAPTSCWGHSQGGHASLFTGQLARSYAPDLELLGVAAGAPVPNLKDLFAVNIETTVGRILIAMALDSWARVYDEASLDQIVAPVARPLVGSIARNCLYNPADPLLGPCRARARPQVPPHHRGRPNHGRRSSRRTRLEQPTGVPILITQGETDPIVPPRPPRRSRASSALSADGRPRLLPDTAHLDAGQVAVPQVVEWIADRFAGKLAPTTCK